MEHNEPHYTAQFVTGKKTWHYLKNIRKEIE